MVDIYEKILLSTPADTLDDLDTSDIEICYTDQPSGPKKPEIEYHDDEPEEKEEPPKQPPAENPPPPAEPEVKEEIKPESPAPKQETKPEPRPEFKPDFSVLDKEPKPEFKPNFNAPKVDLLIDFVSPTPPHPQPTKPKDAVDLLFGNDNQNTTEEYIKLYESNQDEFARKIFTLDDTTLSETFFDLAKKHPDCGLFILHVSQKCGLRAKKVLNALPALPQTQRIHDYLESKRSFIQKYDFFEGNYSLGEFTKAHKSNPPPPGNPPISLDVLEGLQTSMDLIIPAFREKPEKVLLDECLALYQIMAYIIAKLIQFNISKSFVEVKSIPLYKNHHFNLKKAIDNSNFSVNFPEACFNFEDQNIIRRLRPPASNITIS